MIRREALAILAYVMIAVVMVLAAMKVAHGFARWQVHRIEEFDAMEANK